MLHTFIADNREAIIARTRQRVQGRPWPSVSTKELEHGVPLFLTQLSETLRLESTSVPFPTGAIGDSATQHGSDLLGLGYSVAQVVQDYGDICQAVTEIAVETKAPITTEEFHTLNRCLDTAIAQAVTEHARITSRDRTAEEVERMGHTAHEARDILNTAFLAFQSLKRGDVAINGSTGAVLGRSLMGLRDLIDRVLSEVRLVANIRRLEHVAVVGLIDEIAATGNLHAEYRHIAFKVEPVAAGLIVEADPQLLNSAVMNILHNAFKNTKTGGHVALRAFAEKDHLRVEVEDECGGIPPDKGDLFKTFGDRSGVDRSGLGMGLSIARKAVRAHGGDISIHNMPGRGCVFAIEMPLAATSGTRPRVLSQTV